MCKSKLDGLPAPTREAKLGCVFTQTVWDTEGFAIPDSDTPPTPSPQPVRNILDPEGPYAILALRCSHLNGQFEEYRRRRQVAPPPLFCRIPQSALG
jgi:hypothetical protein